MVGFAGRQTLGRIRKVGLWNNRRSLICRETMNEQLPAHRTTGKSCETRTKVGCLQGSTLDDRTIQNDTPRDSSIPIYHYLLMSASSQVYHYLTRQHESLWNTEANQP
ncbi:hypothetical protein BDR07DRAFT_1392422 [Suillus spraguei]|nr:hypothetical protein BDR07DRAFT_1392422 [Suillus spraguei]